MNKNSAAYRCSAEYDANEGRMNRIKRYRQLAMLDEDYTITEDDIIPWALGKTCVEYNCPAEKLRAELLGIRWSEYEN